MTKEKCFYFLLSCLSMQVSADPVACMDRYRTSLVKKVPYSGLPAKPQMADYQRQAEHYENLLKTQAKQIHSGMSNAEKRFHLSSNANYSRLAAQSRQAVTPKDPLAGREAFRKSAQLYQQAGAMREAIELHVQAGDVKAALTAIKSMSSPMDRQQTMDYFIRQASDYGAMVNAAPVRAARYNKFVVELSRSLSFPDLQAKNRLSEALKAVDPQFHKDLFDVP